MFEFNGEFNHQLDAKNRIRVPAKFKGGLGEKYYFAKGTDKCVWILPESTYQQMAEEMNKISPFDAEKSRGRRMFFKSVYPMEEDAQGRVVFPSKLKEYAEIDKDIVITGAGAYIEIWSADVYDKYFEDDDYTTEMYKLSK